VIDPFEQLSAEVANARGDARTARDAVFGTPSLVGLRERLQANSDAIAFQRDREQERWASIESALSRIERNQVAHADRMTALERRQVHPAAVWLIVIALLVASGSACWSVFGKPIRDEYALLMGCAGGR
jgi:hypothetical protein